MTEMCKVKHGIEIPKSSKRYSNLYSLAFSKESLYAAYLDARKKKRNKIGTYMFETHLAKNIDDLHKELESKSYSVRDYREFVVYEPKMRVIQAPHFRDLVVQHAIYRVIYNIFNPTFIDTSFACRKNGGTHKASEYTQKEMRKYSGGLYFVKLDIKKFFYSIDRKILREIFEKKIKDREFVDLMMMFANSKTSEVGIPIGNLVSQIYSLIYMNEVDQYVKRVLKVKSYVRYVDDFVLIGLTLEQAKSVKDKCELFVKERLGLRLSHWHIQKIKRGINFVGYRTWRAKKFVRKHSLYKFAKAAKKKKVDSMVSIIGHSKNTQSIGYLKQLLETHMSEYEFILPKRSVKCLSM